MFEPYRNRVIKGIAFVMALLIVASHIFLSDTAAAGTGDSGETAFLSENYSDVYLETHTGVMVAAEAEAAANSDN
jgi:hypothetical protein